MSKFLVKCSCLVCREETTVQSLKSHLNKHIKDSEEKECLHCKHKFVNRNSIFCSQSCAAYFTNSKKDWTKIKTGPPKILNKEGQASIYIKRKRLFTKVNVCTICNKFHTRSGKTCSDECYKKQLSLSIKNSLYDHSKNRGRHKKSYLESSFEDWLIKNNITNFLMEARFKNFDEKKTYYADFYFPNLKLIIELDGTQHIETVEYDKKRDEYIQKTYDVKIMRISHKEYIKKEKVGEIKQLLKISK